MVGWSSSVKPTSLSSVQLHTETDALLTLPRLSNCTRLLFTVFCASVHHSWACSCTPGYASGQIAHLRTHAALAQRLRAPLACNSVVLCGVLDGLKLNGPVCGVMLCHVTLTAGTLPAATYTRASSSQHDRLHRESKGMVEWSSARREAMLPSIQVRLGTRSLPA